MFGVAARAVGARLLADDYVIARWNRDRGLPHNTAQAVLQTRDGTFWIGTDDGLCRLDEGIATVWTERQGLSGNMVRALLEDAAGRLWIGTERGLVSHREGRFASTIGGQGYFADVVHQILEDDAGDLWVASDQGIGRVRKQALLDFAADRTQSVNWVVYDEAEGLRCRFDLPPELPAIPLALRCRIRPCTRPSASASSRTTSRTGNTCARSSTALRAKERGAGRIQGPDWQGNEGKGMKRRGHQLWSDAPAQPVRLCRARGAPGRRSLSQSPALARHLHPSRQHRPQPPFPALRQLDLVRVDAIHVKAVLAVKRRVPPEPLPQDISLLRVRSGI